MSEIPITVFIIARHGKSAEKTYNNLKTQDFESVVTIVIDEKQKPLIGNFKIINTSSFSSSQIIKKIIKECKSNYFFLVICDNVIHISKESFIKFVSISEKTGAGIVYSDYKEIY